MDCYSPSELVAVDDWSNSLCRASLQMSEKQISLLQDRLRTLHCCCRQSVLDAGDDLGKDCWRLILEP
jgi:hypothetical protein